MFCKERHKEGTQVTFVEERERGGSGGGVRLGLPGAGSASRVLLLVLVSILSGCTTLPTSPSVMALPGFEKPLEQFHAEDIFCRQWATQRAQETAQSASAGQLYNSGARQQWYDMAYLQCMYAKGNRIPGIPSGLPPPPATTPPPPSPSPPAGVTPPPAQTP
jgi:hypothetical protein